MITGSRNWFDSYTIYRDLERADADLIIHGGAHGADEIAEGWARDHGVHTLVCNARWDRGLGAGPQRNKVMALMAEGLERAGHRVRVLAYPLSESKGTRGMMRECIALGLDVEDRSETTDE